VAVAGNRERLPVLNGVHDFARLRPQVPLRYLRHAHIHSVAPGATGELVLTVSKAGSLAQWASSFGGWAISA
jgi:hypothetical protein